MNIKRFLLMVISISCFFAYAQTPEKSEQKLENAEVSIKFYDRTVYYPGDSENNPVYVYITVSNKGSSTLRFKIADDKMFSVDFIAFNVKKMQLPSTQGLIRKRTTNQTVYFREISLEPGEEYSFRENLKDYLEIKDPSIYYVELRFYPELYRNKNISLTSNRLSLEVRPSPSAASSSVLPVETNSVVVLQPEDISPDRVVEQTIVARQKSLWDQFFLYMDLEEMLKRDPSRGRKYNLVSADKRADMLRSFKADLMLQRIDYDIVAIPSKFKIETTSYSQTEGTVKVIEWFKNDNFMERKRYTYYVRQRDGIWQIYDYTVDNLGTE
ncbi:hypothetical protein [uncultured Treponema sp.]|uniref:hypothetical protein n=1 Tax=uncultured Treponema sp. TaxID=162155 RepID=UPI0025F96DF2|nr:hypothetical protein [uncultured Treponema sp.]